MISMNQAIAGGQPMQAHVTLRPVREAPAPMVDPVAPVETEATEAAAPRRPGRAHLQQDLHHLARDVRHQMKAELHELKRSGNWTPEQAKAVRGMGREFLDDLHAAVKDAGRGRDFDGGKVPEGVRQAMVSLTEKLAAFNGPVEGQEVAPVDKPGKVEGVLVDTLA